MPGTIFRIAHRHFAERGVDRLWQRIAKIEGPAMPSPLQAASPGGDGAPPRWARRVYEVNCAACHGVESDGNGPAARMFVTRPRDFRSGIFKFRSTPSGSLPTDEDLFWHDRTARSE